MRRLIPLILALLLLAACGAEAVPEVSEPTPEPTPTPEPAPTPVPTPAESADNASPGDLATPTPTPERDESIPEEPEFILGPAEKGYTFRCDELGFSLPVPDEAAPYLGICMGIPHFVSEDESCSFYYIYGEDGQYTAFSSGIIVAPRRDFFNPGRFYNESYHSWHSVVAASAEYIYVFQGGIGGTELPMEPQEGQAAATAVGDPEDLRENLLVDEPDALPELTDEAMRAASEALAARGDETLTRAEAAVLIFGALTADNKAADYPLRFTDLEPGSEAARAAAYLDSYGMFARYDEDNEPISDGDLFRPDEGVTRADFIHLLQCALFVRDQVDRYPTAYGEPVPADDLGERVWWESAELDRAWKDGWLMMRDGKLRPDEAITAAEAAKALRSAAGIVIPETPYSAFSCETEWFSLRDACAAALEPYDIYPEPYSDYYSFSAGEGSVLLLEVKEDRARDISFYTAEQGGEGYALGGLLYTMGPENKPLVIELPFDGELSAYFISFEDENGEVRRLLLQMGGIDPAEGCPYTLTEMD